MDYQNLNSTDILQTGFSSYELAEIQRAFSSEYFSVDEKVIHTGDDANMVVLLLSGELIAKCSETGLEQRIQPISCLGLLANLKEQPFHYDVITSRDSEVVKLPVSAFLDYWLKSAKRGLQLMKLIVQEQEACDGIIQKLRDDDSKSGSKLHLAKWLDHWHDQIIKNQGNTITISLSELETVTGVDKTNILKTLSEMSRENKVKLVKGET